MECVYIYIYICIYTYMYIYIYVYFYMQSKLQLFWFPQRYQLLWATVLIPFSEASSWSCAVIDLLLLKIQQLMSWPLPGCCIASFFPVGASDTESVSLLSWLLATWFYTGQGVGGTLQGCGRFHFMNMKLKTKLHKTWRQGRIGLGWPMSACVSSMDPSP